MKNQLDKFALRLTSNCYYTIADLFCYRCSFATRLFMIEEKLQVCLSICSQFRLNCHRKELEMILNREMNENETTEEICKEVYLKYFDQKIKVIKTNQIEQCFTGVQQLNQIQHQLTHCLKPTTDFNQLNQTNLKRMKVLIFLLIAIGLLVCFISKIPK